MRSTDFAVSRGSKRGSKTIADYCKPRRCSAPDCRRLVPANFVACKTHWATVPENLRDAFYRSYEKPERRDAWKAIERYLTIRASLKKLAGVAS